VADATPFSWSRLRAISDRDDLLAAALRLSYFTIAWNGAVGVAALVASVIDGSLALAGLGLTALLDSSASVVLVWRFRRERQDPVAAERLERRAQALIALTMLVIAVYVGTQSIRALRDGSDPHASAFGVILAGASVVVLPWLGLLKFRVASRLASKALRGDALLTAASAALAAVALAALLLSSEFGWWWADPAAALLIATALAIEAMRIAVRHRFG
jgi:divalent metal cation (Fe/Co/Zn/Cd) transporter